MRTAAAYLRVSTEKQDEYSLDSQLKLIRDYAARNDMVVPDEFVFTDDGISGRSARKRPAFNQMIGYAKATEKPFEVILVWKFSRFARNQEESIVYKSMLARSGVEVISISEPLAEGPFGSLIERILEWMDEFYSIRLSGEVKRGMAEKLSRGEPVTAPSFGYDIIDKRYIPNADADLVRRIFRDYLGGKGMRTIATELGQAGIRTKRGNPPDNRWVEYMLTNPVYIGYLRWNKAGGKGNYHRGGKDCEENLYPGTHEPIVDRELFDAVQARIASEAARFGRYQRREQPLEWMLKGLVRCSCCGATLIRLTAACPSMQCHNYGRGKCHTSHCLSIAKANRLITQYLENAVVTLSFPVDPEQPSRPDTDAPDFDHLIDVENLKMRRIMEAYEGGIYTLEEFASRKAALAAQIADLEQQRQDAQAKFKAAQLDPVAFSEKVLSVLEIIRDPDQSESAKGQALRSIISRIVYDKANAKLLVFFYS